MKFGNEILLKKPKAAKGNLTNQITKPITLTTSITAIFKVPDTPLMLTPGNDCNSLEPKINHKELEIIS